MSGGESGGGAGTVASGGKEAPDTGGSGAGDSVAGDSSVGGGGEGGAPVEPPMPGACTEDEYNDGASCQPLTVCGADEFEESPPKADQDRVCAPATLCEDEEYEKAAPSAGSDRLCSPLSVCGAGTFVATAPTAQADRECSPCEAGTFSDSLNAEACVPWASCKSGETESVPPSLTSNRICSSCGAGKYEANGQCLALTVCGSNQYESTPATATTDRKCQTLTTCERGSRQTAAPTATTDRQCAACSSGTFSTQTNATSCAAWSKCDANEYESLAPSAQRDRTCSALTTCAPGTRIKTASTATTDRVCEACGSGTFTATANQSTCQAWSNCAAGFSATAGSASKDRACTACASGTFSTAQNSSSCKAWTKCSDSEKQTVAGTATSDAVCCPTAAGRTCTTQCPCASTEGVCTANNQCVSGATCVAGSGKKVGRSGDTCLATHCNNDKVDGGETSVDCGGECGCRATFEVVTVKNVPAGATFSQFRRMSGDGTTIAAHIARSRTSYPAVVAADGTLTELENYGKGGGAEVVSANGQVVIGTLGCANPPTCTDATSSVMQWTGSSAPKALRTGAMARAVSSSGTIVAGDFYDLSVSGQRGFMVNGTQGSTISALFYVAGMTPDGKYLVGSTPTAVNEGVLYNVQAKTVTTLGSTSWTSNSIYGVNGTDPAVIGRGYISSTDTYIGYRWKGGVLTPLGLLAGGKYTSPNAISADGSTVVGTTGTNDLQLAFIWTEADGLRTIVDELRARGVEPPIDLSLRYANSLSDDGKVIVGSELTQPPTFWRVTLQ